MRGRVNLGAWPREKRTQHASKLDNYRTQLRGNMIAKWRYSQEAGGTLT